MSYFYYEVLFISNKFKYLIYIATIMFYVCNIVIVDLALHTEIVLQKNHYNLET